MISHFTCHLRSINPNKEGPQEFRIERTPRSLLWFCYRPLCTETSFSFFSPRIRVKNSYNQLWLMKLRILPQIPINLIQILITFAHKKHSTLLPLFQVSFENPIIQKCSFNYNIDFTSLLGVGLIQLVLIMCIEWSD